MAASKGSNPSYVASPLSAHYHIAQRLWQCAPHNRRRSDATPLPEEGHKA